MLLKKSCLLSVLLLSSCFLFAQKAHIHINIDRQIKKINDSLQKYSTYRSQIKLLNDSVFMIEHRDVKYNVNVKQLRTEYADDPYDNDGIRLDSMRPGSHVEDATIYFHSKHDALIRFNYIPNEITRRIYNDFIRLRDLMIAYMKRKY